MTFTAFSETTKYTAFGIIFGFWFPVGSIVFLYLTGGVPHADGFAQMIARAHGATPLMYVIDSAPFFLGLAGFFAGIRQDRIRRFSESLEIEVAEKTESLQRALEEARKANEMIAQMAEQDSLTGLLNRRRFQKELGYWTDYAMRYQRTVALMFIDLDGFKAINDAYGHAVGDDYLVRVAEILGKAFRSTDYLARWGGDEFAVLLPETDAQSAMAVANKVLHLFHDNAIAVAGEQRPIAASIGIALLPIHTHNANELVAFADAAMYEAKQRRTGWCLYSASAQQTRRVEENIRWEARIRRALESDQFVLLYQPLLTLGSAETRHYEALMRLEDREGQLISPRLFMESAKRFNLSVPIDRMVIRKVARRVSGLKSQRPDLVLSVNLSEQSLSDARLVSYVKTVSREAGISTGQLSFEISEQAALENLGKTRKLAEELKELGCGLMLDDFGLGFSSLHYLQQLSVSIVKIDGGLIRDIRDSSRNRGYIKAVTTMAHDLGIAVAAKSVEDPDLLDVLRELGVDYAQGFAVGRPIESIEEVALTHIEQTS